MHHERSRDERTKSTDDQDLRHARLGTVRGLGTPLRLRSSPVRLERAGPLLGEHSAEVLREIGHSEDEVAAFVARGTVAAA